METFQKSSAQCRLIMLLAAALFLPFYVTVVIFLIAFLYTLIKKDMLVSYQHVKGSLAVVVFTVISLLVSLYYGNVAGILCSVAVFLIFSIAIYAQNYGNQELMMTLMRFFVFMSIFCGIYAFCEYMNILRQNGIDHFVIKIYSSPAKRINAMFFNANYYAMMIEFFVVMIVYLFFQEKRAWYRGYLVAAGLFNLFILYLTGCRMAWPVLGLALFVVVYMQHDRRWLALYLAACALIIFMIYLFPGIIPRVDNVQSGARRLELWSLAWKHIRKYPLFGKGPMTYMFEYNGVSGYIQTQHVHSLYLEPLFSHGIVGVLAIVPYFYERVKEWHQKGAEIPYRAVFYAMLVAVLTHGLVDYTIYFVPTAFLFLLVGGATFTKKTFSKS